MMTGSAEVTVVIVNYNQERFLREAVASVQAQTVPVRIIVVDDASTDESGAILDALPSSIQVLRRRTNGGVVAARNEGLAAVETPLVVFLDADDMLRPRFVELTQSALGRAHDERLAIVYTAARRLYSEPVGRLRRRRGYFLSKAFDPALLALENFISNTSLLRTDALREVGGYAAAMEPLGHEDWELFVALAERGWRGRLLPRPLFCYRIHPSGRNASSLQHYSDVQREIRHRHPGPFLRAESLRAWESVNERFVEATQLAWCLLDLLAWWRSAISARRAAGRSNGCE
jgi:glycosyltransferase involved in cell wall biosynthesis